MSQEPSNATIIFGSILRPAPTHTYSKKGKRKASTDLTAIRVTKKRLRDVSTQHEPRAERYPRENEIAGEERAVVRYEKYSQATIHMDNEISFLPEYSDAEEESSDDSDGIIDMGHSFPRRPSTSSKSSTPQAVDAPDEVEDTNEANAGQGDEKKPTPVSYHDHRRRPGRPFLHQHKGLRRRPYLIFNQTPSHRIKELPKSDKKKTIFASRKNLADGFSENEAKHSGLTLLTKNGRNSTAGTNFGPLDVTQSRSPKEKPSAKEKGPKIKLKGRRANFDDNSFEPLPKNPKKFTQNERSNLPKADNQRPAPQEKASSEKTIVNSTILDLPEAQEQAVEPLPDINHEVVDNTTLPQDKICETQDTPEQAVDNTTLPQDKIDETQYTPKEDPANYEPPQPSSDDDSVQFIILNSDHHTLPKGFERRRTITATDSNSSWETYIPESSYEVLRASSVPAPSTHSSPASQAPSRHETQEQQPSSPSLPLPIKLTKQTSFSAPTRPRTPFQRTLRRIHTQ
ncbi:hypothetical protein QBC38DRAFT_546889 [Podospora fimiseda]|uniref:Uncharacterized protein n=1 Tax=Podospora fimiseda TaxID=252190 RepID=A0AAN7GVT4_9PEZI|nr:hypothetical protein QBC38DRAFT_546889 [Podospora fimiseda]